MLFQATTIFGKKQVLLGNISRRQDNHRSAGFIT